MDKYGILVGVVIIVSVVLLHIRYIWSWLKENHNQCMIVVATGAVVLAFPYFSKQINNVQVQIDSVQSNIQELYNRQEFESFTTLKDFELVTRGDKSYLKIPLKNKPIKGSVTVWFFALVRPPYKYYVEENFLFLEGDESFKREDFSDVDELLTVLYIKNLE